MFADFLWPAQLGFSWLTWTVAIDVPRRRSCEDREKDAEKSRFQDVKGKLVNARSATTFGLLSDRIEILSLRVDAASGSVAASGAVARVRGLNFLKTLNLGFRSQSLAPP
jgi:hypothetical protein